MARPRQFDPQQALDAAVGVFREHGYAATSAEMLTEAMQIGKQSLYNTFGGKWPLYCAALERYAAGETQSHIAALQQGATAWAGIERMLKRVVAEAHSPCLGVGSVSEFGSAQQELVAIRAVAAKVLQTALVTRIREAQAAGDVAADVDPGHAASFVLAQVAALRIAARGGAPDAELRAMARLALRALG